MITITKVGSLVKIDGIEGKDNVYESISNFQGARMSADGTQLSLQIGEVNIDYKPLANFTIGGTVPTNAATVQSALALVFPSAAPATALPTEYPATYAAMQASITADPTTKRDFFVSADETNLVNGVAQSTRYYYNGTAAKRLVYAEQVMKQILVNNTPLSVTGTTLETTVFTGTIPANTIGLNGSFHIIIMFSFTNNANNKIFRVKMNGTAVISTTQTTSASGKWYMTMHNRNSLTTQAAVGGTSGGSNLSFGISAGGATPLAINTGADITVTVTVQNANVADTGTVEAFQLLAIG